MLILGDERQTRVDAYKGPMGPLQFYKVENHILLDGREYDQVMAKLHTRPSLGFVCGHTQARAQDGAISFMMWPFL
jgi:predicted NUDIX family phosphoesterase